MATAPSPSDKRQTDRVPLEVPARLLIGEEAHEGTLIDLSMTGVSLHCMKRPQLGQRIVVYAEGVSRFEGTAVRLFKHGFAINFSLTETKKARLRQKLAEISGQALPEVEPLPAPVTAARAERHKTVRFDDGSETACEVLDASVVGLTLKSAKRPPLGTSVTVGDARAKVTRHTASGFVVEFEGYWAAVSANHRY